MRSPTIEVKFTATIREAIPGYQYTITIPKLVVRQNGLEKLVGKPVDFILRLSGDKGPADQAK